MDYYCLCRETYRFSLQELGIDESLVVPTVDVDQTAGQRGENVFFNPKIIDP